MTPEEKAKELVDRFTFIKLDGTIVRFDRTIQCALICVDEIMKLHFYKNNNIKPKYWNEVKQEIEKL